MIVCSGCDSDGDVVVGVGGVFECGGERGELFVAADLPELDSAASMPAAASAVACGRAASV